MPKFFWVNQGSTYAAERACSCLWAPEITASGSTLNHWESMTQIAPGDIVLNYVSGAIRSFAIAKSSSFDAPKPYAAGAPYNFAQGGRQVLCEYFSIAPWLPIANITANAAWLTDLKSGTNPVLDASGKVNLKYLCEINQITAQGILALTGAPINPAIALPSKTMVKALVAARIGQGPFRNALLAVFGGVCPITGLARPELLVASHIMPWSVGSDSERLDSNNGILLAAGIDSAFDKGLITFDASGALIVSPLRFSAAELSLIGTRSMATLPATFLTVERIAYLQYHQTNVFS